MATVLLVLVLVSFLMKTLSFYFVGNIENLKFQNVVATPHIGAQTKEAQLLAANIIAEKIIQVLRGVL